MKLSSVLTVVDYGMGNVGSILNMLKKIGHPAKSGCCPDDLVGASRLILPGVGTFDQGMSQIQARGLRSVLDQLVLQEAVPVLGICLGMQLLGQSSEEGTLPGLGWLKARTRRFQLDPAGNLKIPHMGWNLTRPVPGAHLFAGYDEIPRFYFVHSYHVVCENQCDVQATTRHGYDFTAAVGARNILGVQFHPEKSHRFGMKLLRNFLDWSPSPK